jgi:hypothetical protein
MRRNLVNDIKELQHLLDLRRDARREDGRGSCKDIYFCRICAGRAHQGLAGRSGEDGGRMRERLEMTLAAVVILVLGVLWWTQYVQPKHAVLASARECMTAAGVGMDDKEQWRECFDAAADEHETGLLRVAGY